MTKFITKPDSKFDERFLFGACLLSCVNLDIMLSSVITTWWLVLLLDVVSFIIIVFVIQSLYNLKYNKNFVYFKLIEKVNAYINESVFGSFLSCDIQKGCKIIDEICKATIVPIEERKLLFDRMCFIWTEYGGSPFDENKRYVIPNFIVEKWKRAQVEYKKFEIENE